MTHQIPTAPRAALLADDGALMTGGSLTPGVTEPSPFGGRQLSRGGRIAGALGITAVLAGAAVVSWMFTRGSNGELPAAEHNHAAVPAAQSGQPVMLTADQAHRIGVTYAVAVEGQLAAEVRTVAQVTFDETRVKSIAPKLDGWIDGLYVNYTGQPVRAGEPLLAIYSPMLVQAQQELILAEQLLKDVDAAGAEARAGAADLRAAARRRLLYWDITPADIERIERTGEVRKSVVLRAPASGVVVEKNVLAGQKIMAGDALYKVADLSVVWIEGEVFERDLAAVHVGQSVEVEFQALPSQSRTGRIAYIYPTISPETRTARVRVAMSNPDLALKPGMYATIRIQGASAANVLTLPRSAVLSTGERNLVFVRREDGMLEPRNVTIGAANDERIEITSGLQKGESVVASATFLVDAESNLSSLLGGMGNMPGMDMSAPAAPNATTSKQAAPAVPAAAPKPDTPHEHE
jgi:membrane fusion protein, copper/silver efflux system